MVESTLQRAAQTATLAGFTPQLHAELRELNYGDYEGRTTAEIRRERPDWDLWRDGCPGGEDAAAVGRPASTTPARHAFPAEGDVLVFAHGHLLRARSHWLGLPAIDVARLALD